MKPPDIWVRNITAIAEKEKQENIRPVCRSVFHWSETGTHLLVSFHGFSNGPFQMDKIFERLDPKKWSYMGLRLPGSGGQGDKGEESIKSLPKSDQWQGYSQFADFTKKWLSELPNPSIAMVGLSTGAIIALDIAQQMKCDQLIMVSPFFKSASYRMALFVRFILLLARWGMDCGKLLDRISTDFTKKDHRGNPVYIPGNNRVSFGQLLAIDRYVRTISFDRCQAKRLLMMITACDQTADPHYMVEAWDQISKLVAPKNSKKIVYTQDQQIPHALTSEYQISNADFQMILKDITMFIDQSPG